MTEPVSPLDFGDCLIALIESIPAEQARLDSDYLARSRYFMPVLETARANGYEEVAREAAPSQMVITEADIQASFRLTLSRSAEFSLVARPLNLAYTRRYEYSEFTRSKVRATVRRAPMQPVGTNEKQPDE